MILSTVTLNPAIDKTYYVNDFLVDGLNRTEHIKTNMGGKGVNVSAVAAKCGITCMATGLLSGYNGQMIGKFLKDLGVLADFVYTEGETRVNIKIIDKKNQTYTDLNEMGPAVSQKSLQALCKKVSDMATRSDVVYMGGSFHPSLGADIYKTLIEIIKEKGAKAVLDADGDAFRLGIEAMPHIVKPNQAEAERLLGRKIKSVEDATLAATAIQKMGIETVLLSLGGNGAILAGESGVYRAYPLKAPVVSTVGAGDSFLCGYLYGKAQNASDADALRYAIAFSAAKIQMEGTDIPTFEKLVENKEKVTVEQVE